MIYTITNKNNGVLLARQACVAHTFGERLVGLMFRAQIPQDHALLFYHASSIHTCFMRFPIDVVFLSKEMRVLKVSRAVKPWRLTGCLNAFLTIEFAASPAGERSCSVGDSLELSVIEEAA